MEDALTYKSEGILFGLVEDKILLRYYFSVNQAVAKDSEFYK